MATAIDVSGFRIGVGTLKTTDIPQIGSVGDNGSPATAVSHPIHKVATLHKLYMEGDRRYLVGFYNFEGGVADAPFYVGNTVGALTNGPKSYILPTVASYNGTAIAASITSSGADWQILPYRTKPDPAAAQTIQGLTIVGAGDHTGFWAISTNGIDQPWVWASGDALSPAVPLPDGAGNFPLVLVPMQVVRSDQQNLLPVSGTDTSTKVMYGVKALAAYNGAIVYGGFRLSVAASTTPGSVPLSDNFDNYICFSDTGTPHLLAQTGGVVSSIRIGDTDAEKVTAIGLTTVPTDSLGLKGQLCVFTGSRVVIFDGIPPSTDNPTGVNFQSVITRGVGCKAPKSVVQTPHGLVFLGTDGYFYIIRGLAGPEKLGAAVWPIFRGMTEVTLRQIAAYWDPRDFYKVSYPEPGEHSDFDSTQTYIHPFFGNLDVTGANSNFLAEATTNNRQLWCDLRGLSQPGEKKDIGARWFGPMTGMMHSCFAVANGSSDRNEMYAGSSIDGSIYQVGIESLTTDPVPTSPQTTRPIDTVAVTGVFDMGDAHVDKMVSAFNYGIGSDKATTVYASCIISPSDQGIAQAQADFTDTVTPPGDLMDSTFVLGTSQTITGDSINTMPHRPGSRLRGKLFRFVFHETAAAGARMFYSDLSFRVTIVPRRK